MTFVWYGHLKMRELKWIGNTTHQVIVILISWGIALLEYCCQVPRKQYRSSRKWRTIPTHATQGDKEAITLIVLTLFTVVFFNGGATALESFRRVPLPHSRRLACIPQIISE